MERLSVLLIVLTMLLFVKIDASVITEKLNYVTPNKGIECSTNRSQFESSCLTLQEYASRPDVYFKNDTIFYFEPGEHKLNSSLKLENLSNVTLQGSQGNGELKVIIYFETSVTVTWEQCRNIEVSSITFNLLDNFIYVIVFSQSQAVLLRDIFVNSTGIIAVSGCSSIVCQQSEVRIVDCKFWGIQGSLGAAMFISESNATFIGNVFHGNTASYGGSLYLFNSLVLLNGTIFLHNNSSNQDMHMNDCSYMYTLSENHLTRSSGGAIYSNSSNLTIGGAVFLENFALQGKGGALSAENGVILFQGITLFFNNFALGGGAILINSLSVKVNGNISFINNGAIGERDELLTHLSEEFESSSYYQQLDTNIIMAAGLSTDRINLSINFDEFCENSVTLKGGAIQTVNSDITVDGKVKFKNNTAFHGGAMFLARTKLMLSSTSKMSFIQNHADSKGGAIYVKDVQCSFGSTHRSECFLSIANCASMNKLLLFKNNFAENNGSTLYGGQLNECRLHYYGTKYNEFEDGCGNTSYRDHRDGYSDDALGIFMSISRIHDESESATNISSQADKFKFCEGERPLDCPIKNIELHPGEEFNITVIALDQIGSPVPTIVFNDHNEYTGNKYRLRPPSQQIEDAACANITFQLLSDKEKCHKLFKLYPDNPCQSLANGLRLIVNILACPIGFELKDRRCECDSRLSKFTQSCMIRNLTRSFKRNRNNFWISKLDSDTLIIYEYRCPLDYCKDDSDSINVTLEDPSVQCDFNRNGILCGRCQKYFDLALGSLHCIPCNNNYHSALILFFALAGVVLIAIVFILRFTVSVGTLHGLLFYANVIQANHQAYFPRVTTRVKFFTIFISWLNLDFGIETCFYDGMDIYAYSWLQFLFPFYLLLLVGCIILACRYSHSIAKRLGKNPVAVLATLLLMSFSKTLQASIVPLSWTHLVYYSGGMPSNDARSVVWLYDASIQFFKEPKHTVLGLFAITSLFVFVLPYILLLLFGHWLQGCSNWRILSWLNRIKPFMDAYHAPYRMHTRYWTGLLLLSRLGLFLTFAINANGSENVNLVAVSSVTLALLAIQRRVYEHRWKDLLESFFILNLGIFSVATFYLKEESKDASQFVVSSISVGIAFISFIGILTYHIYLVFKSASNLWKLYLLPFFQKIRRIFKATSISEGEKVIEGEEKSELHTLPTSSDIGVHLREPLLELESESESQIRAAYTY